MTTIISRRKFLKNSSALACGSFLSSLARTTHDGLAFGLNCTPSNKTLVHIYLNGGLNSTQFLAPRPTSPAFSTYLEHNPTTGVGLPGGPEALALADVSEVGLHPELTLFQALLNAQHPSQMKLAIVNKVGYPNPNYSHSISQKVYATGSRSGYDTELGWIGKFADTYCNSVGYSVFSFRGRADELRASSFNPLIFDDLANFRYVRDYLDPPADQEWRLKNLKASREADTKRASNVSRESMYQTWKSIDDSVGEIQQVVDSYSAIDADNKANYPESPLAKQLRQAAILIRGGLKPSFILTSQGGYDLHWGCNVDTPLLFRDLNSSLEAFIRDLTFANLQDSVAILIETEFGRNTFENASVYSSGPGHDHGAGTLTLVIDSRVARGLHGPMYQSSDFYNPSITKTGRGDLEAEIDFREVRSQVLSYLGVDPQLVISDMQRLPSSGIRLF